MALPSAVFGTKNHGALMMVVNWIVINGFCPGRRASTAISGIIVETISDDGNGDREGAAVGFVVGTADGKEPDGFKLGLEVGNVDGENDGIVLGAFVGF
jgi:hypothetical protein